jgi:transcriptional regulator with XRE-family HTH domain
MIRHGHYLGYLTDKCRDECCRAAWTNHKAQTRKLQAYGRTPRLKFTDATRARDHVQHLRDFGLSLASIATLAGENTSRIAELIYENGHNYPKRIATDRETRILAIRFDLDRIPPGRTINSAGTRRRIEALMCMGWTQRDIGRRLGVTAQMVSLHRHRAAVLSDTARKIRDLYDEMWDQPGDPRRARLALERGFAPPLAWDDDSIDDPAATPHDLTPPRKKAGGQGRPAEDVVEDIEFLLGHHPHATSIELAERLGYSDPSGVQNALVRTGRDDLRAVLNRNAVLAGLNVTRRTA